MVRSRGGLMCGCADARGREGAVRDLCEAEEDFGLRLEKAYSLSHSVEEKACWCLRHIALRLSLGNGAV